MSIDFTKPLQMIQNGRKLRLLCTNGAAPFPVICLTEDTAEIRNYTFDGRLYVGGPVELMNVPEEVTVDVWVNVYRAPDGAVILGYTALTKPDALSKNTHDGYIATFHIKHTVPVGHVDE